MKLTIDVNFRDDDWEEAKHPRGQPENAGEFASGSGSSPLDDAVDNDVDEDDSEPYVPNSAHEKAVYASIKSAQHFKSEETNIGIDAGGHKIKAISIIDISKIAGDGHASVSSALADGDETSEQVDSAMHDYSKKVYKGLGANREAVNYYQAAGYTLINHELRENEGVPQDEAAKNIQKVIAASAVPADMWLWRGMHADLKELTGFDDPAAAVGRCFIHKSFTSSSRSQESAENFGTTTMLKFHVKAGTPGLVILGQGSYAEREIILNTRSMFKILKVERGADYAGHVLHVEYLGVVPDAVETTKMAA